MVRDTHRARVLSALLIVSVMLPCVLVSAVMAAGPYPFESDSIEVSAALDYLSDQQMSDGKISDFSTSAWAVMAIAAAGEDPNDWRVNSNPSVVDYLATSAGSANATNDYSRMILAIVAAGHDPADFGGRDFVSLLKATYDGTQIGDSSLLNDDFWGVMALVAAGYDTTTSDAIHDSVSFILEHQNADGGWSWGVGQDSDVDSTAAALMALIAAGQSVSSNPIEEALSYIKSTQMDNGGFESWGATNSATNSWAIDAIAAAGQDPTGPEWTNNAGNDPVDDLLTFQNADGSFNWSSDDPSAQMTAYAINALVGRPYPVAIQEPIQDFTYHVRVEGLDRTIWSGSVTVEESTIVDDEGVSHHFDQPTALGALHEASLTGDFTYVVQDTSFGLYVYSIAGEEPEGSAGWFFRVDYYSPMVGAADFILNQTTPPDPPHREILFAYSQWGEPPLRLEVDNTTPDVGETFTVTVNTFDDDTGDWSPTENATVYANQHYVTGPDGTVDITIDTDWTLEVRAEKDGHIRSNRVTVTVGTGSYSKEVSMSATIMPAISFSVNIDAIDFGDDLAPGDSSAPVPVTVTNTGAWQLLITAQVTDAAQNLYVDGLILDGVGWDEFSAVVARQDAIECDAVLSVPETYPLVGRQDGTLIFWASDGR